MRRRVSALAFALASSVTAATSTNPSGGDMRIVTSSLTYVTSLEETKGRKRVKSGCHCRLNGDSLLHDWIAQILRSRLAPYFAKKILTFLCSERNWTVLLD